MSSEKNNPMAHTSTHTSEEIVLAYERINGNVEEYVELGSLKFVAFFP